MSHKVWPALRMPTAGQRTHMAIGQSVAAVPRPLSEAEPASRGTAAGYLDPQLAKVRRVFAVILVQITARRDALTDLGHSAVSCGPTWLIPLRRSQAIERGRQAAHLDRVVSGQAGACHPASIVPVAAGGASPARRAKVERRAP
jgi:hypothetical protein